MSQFTPKERILAALHEFNASHIEAVNDAGGIPVPLLLVILVPRLDAPKPGPEVVAYEPIIVDGSLTKKNIDQFITVVSEQLARIRQKIHAQ